MRHVNADGRHHWDLVRVRAIAHSEKRDGEYSTDDLVQRGLHACFLGPKRKGHRRNAAGAEFVRTAGLGLGVIST